MQRKGWITLVMVTIFAMVLAGCGGGSEEPTPEAAAPASAQEAIAQTLEVAMHDLYYGDSNNNIAEPPVWTVKSGTQVQVNMDNQGGLQHNWAVVKLGAEVPVPYDAAKNGDILLFEAGVVESGQQGSYIFTAPEAGEYAVICTVAGHYPSMQGKLVVE
jgi:uncharacterized cupredoxin-like copper-binding protein